MARPEATLPLSLALANGYPMVFEPEDVRFDFYPNFLWGARQSDQIPQRFEAANLLLVRQDPP